MKKFYVGIKGIVVDKQKGVLLLHRDYASGDFWDVPGGRIDGEEIFTETLTRELQEELPGIVVHGVGKLLGAYRVRKNIDSDVSLVLLYFETEATLPDPIVLSEEHESYTWVKNKSDIPDTVNEQVAKILQEVLPT